MDMNLYFEQRRKATREALEKIKNPMTAEELRQKYPETRPQVIKKVDVEEEMTDEEYDHIYYAQEDDTVNESFDGDYNPYGHNIYDEKMPDDFELWDNRVKNAWREAHKIGEE